MSSPGSVAPPGTPFSPQRWVAALVSIGGGYALASGSKLWLVVQGCSDDALASVVAQIANQPDRIEAVRSMIERRQNGEAF